MPCSDGRYDDCSRDDGSSIIVKALDEFKHNSPVAELLCTAIKIMEQNGITDVTLPDNLLEWKKEHEIRDCLKKIKEKNTRFITKESKTVLVINRDYKILGEGKISEFQKYHCQIQINDSSFNFTYNGELYVNRLCVDLDLIAIDKELFYSNYKFSE